MPQASVYFVVLLLNYTSGMPWKVLPWNVLWDWIRGKEPSKDPVFFDVATEGCGVALALMLTTTFSVISPAIMLSAAVFFSFATGVYSWMFENVYGKKIEGSAYKYHDFESHGEVWHELFQVSMTGLVLSASTVSGIVLSKALTLQEGEVTFDVWMLIFACLLLLMGVLRFWSKCLLNYHHYSESMTYEDAIALDGDPGQQAIVDLFSGDYYRDPMSDCIDYLYSSERSNRPGSGSKSPGADFASEQTLASERALANVAPSQRQGPRGDEPRLEENTTDQHQPEMVQSPTEDGEMISAAQPSVSETAVPLEPQASKPKDPVEAL